MNESNVEFSEAEYAHDRLMEQLADTDYFEPRKHLPDGSVWSECHGDEDLIDE